MAKWSERGIQEVYQIKVQGKIDESWSEWLNGVAITSEVGSNSSPITTLTATVSDQAALRGILSRIWDLNLALISVVLIEEVPKVN